MAETTSSGEPPVTIKKYANRRLYNTATSSYVTLEHLCQMVKDGTEFAVYDAKTGEDITRFVLTQIIFEEEGKGQNLLPISFLRQLIRFYGDSLQSMVPSYLEMSMEAFARNQEQIRRYMAETLGDANPFRHMEEVGRHNVAMFEQAMNLFSPYRAAAGESAGSSNGAEKDAEAAPAKAGDGGASAEELAGLRDQLAQMQEQLDRLAKK